MDSTAGRRLVARISEALKSSARCANWGGTCPGIPTCDVCTVLASVHVAHALDRLHQRKPLTERQRHILDFIEETLRTRRIAPSYEEIAEHFGFLSLATVHEHLINLQRKGWIHREPSLARAITLVEEAVA